MVEDLVSRYEVDTIVELNNSIGIKLLFFPKKTTPILFYGLVYFRSMLQMLGSSRVVFC